MAVSELEIGEFLAALGERTPAPASGAAAALTGAFAAGLVELAARFAEDEAAVGRAKALAARLAQLADEDAAAYTTFMENRTEEARQQTIDVPLDIAANADEVEQLAGRVGKQLRSSVAGDAEAGAELARAAARVARRLAELNTPKHASHPTRKFARLPQPPSTDEIDASERPQYDAVVERTARVHGLEGQAGKYFGALLNSPPLAAALTELGARVRRGQLRGTYSHAERELMDLVLAVALGSNAILPIHIPDALAVGVRPEAVEAVIKRREHQLSDDERQLAAFARRFAAGQVDDESYAALLQRFGKRGAVEFTVLLGFLLMTIRLWQAFGLPEPTDEAVEELLENLRSGAAQLPDPDARIG